jgi:hypothetical protein
METMTKYLALILLAGIDQRRKQMGRFTEVMEQQRGPHAVTPMPRYLCHKKVWALKIAAIEVIRPTIDELEAMFDGNGQNTGPDIGGVITPTDVGYAPFLVEKAFMDKHDPQVGGYFVVYDDGYKSYSPAKAFEEGYTKL